MQRKLYVSSSSSSISSTLNVFAALDITKAWQHLSQGTGRATRIDFSISSEQLRLSPMLDPLPGVSLAPTNLS
ncbi:hypothetical protein VD0002_g9919 [Verticillium dahliae]|uniref:Uncharacterized protein n=1 Tax=Verticillium dahliae TaxID=27337 RepID=A0AA44WJ78_VERDA|nr:hypothetical protein BJF96_g5088 [Verticillium dahliae]PNH41784.1 hypothetical protein VD0003_g9912 [Verticillium dahliae]PNH55204.1 hypothetical protein VD0002_g9919 [Verticillium dahliae]